MKTDRTKMNAAIFASLKHGGVYGIIDHSARAREVERRKCKRFIGSKSPSCAKKY